MSLNISRLNRSELHKAVHLRMAFIRDIHPEWDEIKIQDIQQGVQDYVQRLDKEGKYYCYLGTIKGESVCGAAIFCYDLPPLHTASSRGIAHVANFFTWPEYRRRGYGKKLMAYILEDWRQLGLDRVVLHATTLGEPLYRAAGFQESDLVALEYDLKRKPL